MVPDEFRHLPKYRGVTGTPRGVNGPYSALVGERRRRPGGGRAPIPIRIGWGGVTPRCNDATVIPEIKLIILL